MTDINMFLYLPNCEQHKCRESIKKNLIGRKKIYVFLFPKKHNNEQKTKRNNKAYFIIIIHIDF